MTRPTSAAAPLSRRFDVASVRDGGTSVPVEATQAECQALARDCDLPGVDALAAAFLVRREGPDGLRVTGRVTARVRRVCVVSLDEFTVALDEAVDVRFLPEAEVEALAAARAARPGTPDEEDADDLPDPIVAGRIDLGALAAEIFVLGLDPYPRKPGVAFVEPAADASAEPEASPFAALRSLKGGGAPS